MRKFPFLCLLPVIIAGCRPNTSNHFPNTISAEVTNPLSESRKNVAVLIPAPNILTDATFIVRSNEVQLAAQRVNKSIFVVLDSMKGNEKRTITIYYNEDPATSEVQAQYRKRTQAELSHRVDGKFRNVDHLKRSKADSNVIRYEGPGWESEKVAYRLYFDSRNAIDVFGKKTSDMVLMGIGQDGVTSYHELQSWGMDIMKVGKSLGLGSIGTWNGQRVVRAEDTDSVVCDIKDGTLLSSVTTNYYGWKTASDTMDITSILSIHGGSRLTYQYLNASKPLCTGIIKDNAGGLIQILPSDDRWGYIATYGKQSTNNDSLGLVILFPQLHFAGFVHDEFNNGVELRPINKKIEYAFAAAWEQEPNGIKTEAGFLKWCSKSARELANPVIVHVK